MHLSYLLTHIMTACNSQKFILWYNLCKVAYYDDAALIMCK